MYDGSGKIFSTFNVKLIAIHVGDIGGADVDVDTCGTNPVYLLLEIVCKFWCDDELKLTRYNWTVCYNIRDSLPDGDNDFKDDCYDACKG